MKLNPNQRTKLERLLSRLSSPEQLTTHYLQQLASEMRGLQAQPQVDLSPLSYVLSDLTSTIKGLKGGSDQKELQSIAKLLKQLNDKPTGQDDVLKSIDGLRKAMADLAKKPTVAGGSNLNPADVSRSIFVPELGSYVVPVTVKIDLAASGDVVAAIVSKKIRVIAQFWTVSADTTIKWQSDATTDLTGAMTIKAGGGMALPRNVDGWIPDTAQGKKLNVVMGSSVQMSGSLTYLPI